VLFPREGQRGKNQGFFTPIKGGKRKTAEGGRWSSYREGEGAGRAWLSTRGKRKGKEKVRGGKDRARRFRTSKKKKKELEPGGEARQEGSLDLVGLGERKKGENLELRHRGRGKGCKGEGPPWGAGGKGDQGGRRPTGIYPPFCRGKGEAAFYQRRIGGTGKKDFSLQFVWHGEREGTILKKHVAVIFRDPSSKKKRKPQHPPFRSA